MISTVGVTVRCEDGRWSAHAILNGMVISSSCMHNHQISINAQVCGRGFVRRWVDIATRPHQITELASDGLWVLSWADDAGRQVTHRFRWLYAETLASNADQVG
jgi:hypothetical protein